MRVTTSNALQGRVVAARLQQTSHQ